MDAGHSRSRAQRSEAAQAVSGSAPADSDTSPPAVGATTSSKTIRRITVAVLMLGIALRILIATFNREANDDHLPVIRILAFEGRIPDVRETWEGFQQLLYHQTAAASWILAGASSDRDQILLAQGTSCLAGILTLLVVARFLRVHFGPTPISALGVGAVALNPALVTISGQATNDAFVILFGTLALHFGSRYFARFRAVDLLASAVASMLAALSKGNGLVVILVAPCALMAGLVLGPRVRAAPRRRLAFALVTFLVISIGGTAIAGRYVDSWREHGTPFATNWEPSPRPRAWREEFVERPGLTSLVHGLLTFRIADLIRHPESTSDRSIYPRHRTSLWTRIYAQTHSAHFEAWPPSWKTGFHWVQHLNRALFVLALLPAALFVVGSVMCLIDVARCFRGRLVHSRQTAGLVTIFLVIAAVGHLAFVAAYCTRVRDYSTMKTIFVLPGLLGLLFVQLRGYEHVLGRARPSPVLQHTIFAASVLLLAGYTLDVAVLVSELAS